MNRSLFLFLLIISFLPISNAAWVSLNGESEGSAPVVALTESDSEGVMISVDVPGFYVDDVELGGMLFKSVTVPNAGRSLDIGFPEVPKISIQVAVPDTGSVTVREIDRQLQALDNYKIAPMQKPTTDLDGQPEFIMERKAYESGSYPVTGLSMQDPAIRRDVRFVTVDVYPIIARPSDESIEAASRITFELSFSDEPGRNEKTRRFDTVSPELDNMYRHSFLNYDSLGLKVGASRDSNIRYLIITVESHVAAITPLADWWNRAGLMTEIKLTSEVGTTPAQIKAAILNYYTTQNTEYVLLVGETTEVALGNTGSLNPGDYDYQLLEGGDTFADIAMGRILHTNNDKISHIVARTLNFVQNPPVDGWLGKTMLCAHEEEYPGKYTECKEFIRTFPYAIENYVYDTYYPPEGATQAQVKAAIEQGRVVVNYRGHGDVGEWSWNIGWVNSNIYALNNGAHTPIVWNIACYCGDITGTTECLSEAWQNAGSSGEGGAVANIGATEPSYTIANHAFDKMLYQAPLNEGTTRLGYVVDRSKQYMIEEEGSYGEDNAYMYIIFGDPAIDIPARTLFDADVDHLPTVSMGGGMFSVTVTEAGSPVEGAMVCIMKDDDGLYEVEYTDATGYAELPTLLTSGGTMQLTVTAHNMAPYMADILVQAAGCGAVLMNQNVYNCDQTIVINVWDSDLNANPGAVETTNVTISSDTTPAGENVLLTETGPDSGQFTGTIMTSDTQSGGGYLQVSDADTITVLYEDADCEGSPADVTDTAGVDCVGPVISDVTVETISTDFFTVTWNTSEPSQTMLTWGMITPPDTDIVNTTLRTSHSVTIEDLDDCTQYYFQIGATDVSGNYAEDNNGGMYYSVVTYELQIYLEANMDTNPGWTYAGQWAWGDPAGASGDPNNGYTGTNVVGYNLNGTYTNNMSQTYCTTQTFDCSEAGEVFLSYYHWLGIESSTWDHASVQVSGNGGSSWTTIWDHVGGSVAPSSWTYSEYDISAVAAGQSSVVVRWVMGTTDSSVVYCGWNLDDVMVSCTLECTSIPTPTPTQSCLHTGDTNLDSDITAGDAQMAFMIALGSITPTYEQGCAADCNGDSDWTAGDAQMIFMTALGTATCVDPL